MTTRSEANQFGRPLTKREAAERLRRDFNPSPEEQDADDIAIITRHMDRLKRRHECLMQIGNECLRQLRSILDTIDAKEGGAQ